MAARLAERVRDRTGLNRGVEMLAEVEVARPGARHGRGGGLARRAGQRNPQHRQHLLRPGARPRNQVLLRLAPHHGRPVPARALCLLRQQRCQQ